MKKNYMEELKNNYNAWLVVAVEVAQDYNAVVTEKYLVFTDKGTLEVEDGKAKETTGLFQYYPKLKVVMGKLEGERKERFGKIFTEIEKEWKEYAAGTEPKSFRVINK